MNTRSSPNRPEKMYETNFNPCQFSKAFQLPNDWNDCLTWEEMKERKRRWPTQSLLLCWQDFFEPAFQISSIFPKIHLFTVAHTVVTLNLFPAGPTGPSTVTFITVSFFWDRPKVSKEQKSYQPKGPKTSMMCQSWAVGSATNRPLWRDKIVRGICESAKQLWYCGERFISYYYTHILLLWLWYQGWHLYIHPTVPSKPRFCAATAAAAIVFTLNPNFFNFVILQIWSNFIWYRMK